jgi:2-methylcitrate dehydratase
MSEVTQRPSPDRLLVDIADYACDYQVGNDLACETAFLCLVDSLACAFQAVRHPACARFLGPVVPGATMAGGARVPGTSYELDPVQAAFNLGAMIRWLDANDPGLAAGPCHPSDSLGGILAVADYLARKSIAEGTSPLTVRDVLAALVKAHEIQATIASASAFDPVGLDGTILVRVATAAVVTPMLGGTRQQVIGALSNAWLDGGALGTYLRVPNPGARKSWAAGDATSRGVRLAMLAIAGDAGCPSALSAKGSGLCDVLFGGRPLALPRALASQMMESLQFRDAEAVRALLQKFESSVAAHFPAGQAAKIGALVADRARTEAMPIHQFVAVMVKN